MAIKIRVDTDTSQAQSDLDKLKSQVTSIANAAKIKLTTNFLQAKNEVNDLVNRMNAMVTTRTVTIKADSKAATQELNNLNQKVSQVVGTKQLTVKSNVGDIANQAKTSGDAVNKLSSNVSGLKSELRSAAAELGLFVTAAAGITAFITYSDQLVKLKSNLKQVSGGQKELEDGFKIVRDVALSTRSDISEIGVLYRKLATESKNLGANQYEVAVVTQNIARSIAASGVSAQVAQAGLTQLGQALSAGRLQGQDLRAVLEDIPTLAQQIANGMGITRDQMRLLAQDGKVTSKEVFYALLKQTESINGEFKKTGVTFSQAFTNVGNSVFLLFAAFKGLKDNGAGIPGIINNMALGIAKFAANLNFNISKMYFRWADFLDFIATSLDPIINKISGMFDKISVPVSLKIAYQKISTGDIFGSLEPIKEQVMAWLHTIERGFFWLYDRVIGHSWIPDLVEGVIEWMSKLLSTPLDYVKRFTHFVSEEFKSIANTKIDLSKIFSLDGDFRLAGVLLGALLIWQTGLARFLVTSITSGLLSALNVFVSLFPSVLQTAITTSIKTGLAVGAAAFSLKGLFSLTDTKLSTDYKSQVTPAQREQRSGTIYGAIQNMVDVLKQYLGPILLKMQDFWDNSSNPLVRSIKQIFRMPDTVPVGPNERTRPSGWFDDDAGIGKRTMRGVVNLIPENFQIPTVLLGSLTAVAGIFLTMTGPLRTIMTSLTGLLTAKVLGATQDEDKLSNFIHNTYLMIFKGITEGWKFLIGEGIFGRDGLKDSLYVLAKMALLFSAGREFLAKTALGTLGAPAALANTAVTKIEANTLNSEVKRGSQAIETLRNQIDTDKRVSAAQLANAKLVNQGAANQQAMLGALAANNAQQANIQDRSIQLRKLEADNEKVKAKAAPLNKQVQDAAANVKAGVTSTATSIGSLFFGMSGLAFGNEIADGMAADTPAWQKVGVVIATAVGGQTLGALIGGAVAFAINTVIGGIGTALAFAFLNPVGVALVGIAAVLMAAANWDSVVKAFEFVWTKLEAIYAEYWPLLRQLLNHAWTEFKKAFDDSTSKLMKAYDDSKFSDTIFNALERGAAAVGKAIGSAMRDVRDAKPFAPSSETLASRAEVGVAAPSIVDPRTHKVTSEAITQRPDEGLFNSMYTGIRDWVESLTTREALGAGTTAAGLSLAIFKFGGSIVSGISGMFANVVLPDFLIATQLWGGILISRLGLLLTGIGAGVGTLVTGALAFLGITVALPASVVGGIAIALGTLIYIFWDKIQNALSNMTPSFVSSDAKKAIASINEPTFISAKKYATGGMVDGSGNEDNVLAWLTPGEHVIKKDIAESNRSALDAINAGILDPKMVSGIMGLGKATGLEASRGNVSEAYGDVRRLKNQFDSIQSVIKYYNDPIFSGKTSANLLLDYQPDLNTYWFNPAKPSATIPPMTSGTSGSSFYEAYLLNLHEMGHAFDYAKFISEGQNKGRGVNDIITSWNTTPSIILENNAQTFADQNDIFKNRDDTTTKAALNTFEIDHYIRKELESIPAVIAAKANITRETVTAALDAIKAKFDNIISDKILDMSDDGVLNNSTGGRIIYGYPPNPSVNVGRDFEGYKQILIQTLTDNYTNSAVMDKLTTKRPGYAYGGHIQGSGSGTSDSIPAMLSNGEFVVNANQTKKFRGLLEGINSGAIQHFEVGGAVARAKAWASSEAQRMHMDPTFVNNIFQIESGFAADARSKMGAVGVGQLMPLTALENGITGLRQDIVDWAKLVAATAKEKGITTAKAIGIVGSAPVDPNDPRLDVENNVRASVLLMTKLKKEFGDDMEKVAAAYNAGSGTVKKALGPDGNLDVSRLPSETREYLVKMGSATKSTISNFGDTIAEQFQKMLDKVLEFGDKFAPGLTHSIRNLIGKGGVGTTDSYLADNMITEGYVRPADKPTTTSDLISRATSISDIADKLYQGLAQVGASTGILVDDLKKLSSDGIRRVANAIDNIKTLRSDKSAINDIAVGEQVKTLLESVKPAGAPIMTIQEKFGTATSQSSQIDVLKASLSKYGLPNVDLTRKTDKELSDLASKLSAIDTQQTKLDTERAKPGFISDIAANARQSGIKNAIGGLADELVVAGKSFFDKVNGISATARDLGTKAASSFEAEFTSGLTDVLTGKTKPKDFKSGLWDAWTKTYLDTLSKSFSNSLFQQTSLKTMVPDIFANGAKLVGWERATGTAPANQFKNQELNDLNKLATPKIAGGQAFGGNSAMDTRSLGLDIKDSLLYTTDVQVSTAKDSADKVVTAVNTMSNDIVTVLTGATPYTKAPDQGPLPAMPPPASADVTAAVEPKMEVAATAEKIAVPARNIFQRVGASVTGFFRSIFGKTAIDVKTASGEMKPQVDTATTSLTGSISNAATDLMNALGGLGSMALSAFGGLGGKIAAGVMQLVQQVGGSGGMMGGVSKLFDGIGAGATSAWNGLFGSGVSDSGGMMTLLDFIPKATGGIISGPGSGTSDSIPIAASNGEFIVNAMATAKHRSLLHAINSGKGFAAGGLVGSSFIPPGDGTLSRANVNNSNQSVFNIHVTGDVSRQTRMEIQKMIPQIATGVGMHNRELGTRG